MRIKGYAVRKKDMEPGQAAAADRDSSHHGGIRESRGPAFIHRSTPSPRLAHGVAVGLVWAALLSIPHWDVCNCRYAAQTSSTTVFLCISCSPEEAIMSFAAPDAYPALPCLAGQMSLRSPSTAYAVYVFILRDAPGYRSYPSVISIIGRIPQMRTLAYYAWPTLLSHDPLPNPCSADAPAQRSPRRNTMLPVSRVSIVVAEQAPAAEPVCDSFVCEVALKHGMAVANLRLNVVSTGLLSLTYPNDTSAPAESPCRARTASKWGASAFESSTANLDSEATAAASLADLCHHPKSSSPTRRIDHDIRADPWR
ncbi:hypothetical protein CSOJ01_02341 [Colletotrichum sojae]|uniref:Uncharacterized protein n=1 Tax=Colletotrichum sojae TaxID=2175907 RepID=A0A8H6JS11_9PEZI|nr:hypothetical protein CSOJ01_02341 [Colletotrichum sojae]